MLECLPISLSSPRCPPLLLLSSSSPFPCSSPLFLCSHPPLLFPPSQFTDFPASDCMVLLGIAVAQKGLGAHLACRCHSASACCVLQCVHVCADVHLCVYIVSAMLDSLSPAVARCRFYRSALLLFQLSISAPMSGW